MNIRPTVFHPSAKSVIFFAGPLAVLLGVMLIVIDDGLNVDVAALGIAVTGGVAVVIMLSFLASRLYTIELGEAGIRAHSFWGKRRFIHWHEIESVRPFSLLNLRYLRLYGPPPSKPVWMAAFIANPSSFREAMSNLAPKDSPVLAHL